MKHVLFFGILLYLFSSCVSKTSQRELVKINDTIKVNQDLTTPIITIEFIQGKAHNHPSFAIWLEDTKGNFLETIFVTKSVGTGIFGHAQGPNGTWVNQEGSAYRPAALPYWSHKKTDIIEVGLQMPNSDKVKVDAVLGATPKASFVLNVRTKKAYDFPVNIMVEVNQPWDWNEFWTNEKYVNNKDYATSCQPSLIYSTLLSKNEAVLLPIGIGHYAGEDGNLYPNLESITTAKHIFETIKVKQN